MMSSKDLQHSIVIPTYNRPELLARSVRSVLAQSTAHFELIIVDDGSATDIDTHFPSALDARITILRSPIHSGVAAARNLGIRASRGRWISFLDDDDEYLPSFLA